MSPTPLPPEPQRSREELLGIVRTRAGVLRRRRRAAISGAVALALAVLGGGMAVSRGLDTEPSMRITAGQGEDHAPEVTTSTSAPVTTSSSVPERISTTSTTTRATSGASTSTTAGRPFITGTTQPSTTSTTSTDAPVCRNSTDARCGPFRWEPEPTKTELTVRVSVLTESPVAGKPVQFKVVADDAATRISGSCYDYSDGLTGGSCAADYPACPDQGTAHGPWAPPEKTPDHLELTPSFTYEKPGTYTVRYTFQTAWPGCHPQGWTDPYADTSSGEVTFTVRSPDGEASTTSSSTTTTTTRPSGGKPS